MADNVIYGVDFKTKIPARYSEFANQVAVEIANVALIPHDRAVDTAPCEYVAPDQDSA